MDIDGRYDLGTVEAASDLYWIIAGRVLGFQDRFIEQVKLVSQAAALFPEFSSRFYAVSQFLTDHPESRYIPSANLIEAVHFNCSGLRIDGLDDPNRHNLDIRDADGTFAVPARSAPNAYTIDAGCVWIVLSGSAILVNGSSPESGITTQNGFWMAFQTALDTVSWDHGPAVGGGLSVNGEALALVRGTTANQAA